MDEVKKCNESLMRNPYTAAYLTPLYGQTEILFQVPIYYSYELETDKLNFSVEDTLGRVEMKCKGLLDGIIINHETKTIQPFDLKTTGRSVYSFPGDILWKGYYLQASSYHTAVDKLQKGEAVTTSEVSFPKDYALADTFDFVVAEKTKSNPARIFPLTPEQLEKGLYGFEDKTGKK